MVITDRVIVMVITDRLTHFSFSIMQLDLIIFQVLSFQIVNILFI